MINKKMRSKEEILDEMKTIPYDEKDYRDIVEALLDIRDILDAHLLDVGMEIRDLTRPE